MLKFSRKSQKITIKGVKTFDIKNSIDAIDYLIFMLNEFNCLTNRVLIDSPEKSSLFKYCKDFEKETKNRFSIAVHYSQCFYQFFVNEVDEFIFADYFFKNPEINIAEKKSKLNKLVINLINQKKIILELTKELDFNDIENFNNNTEKRFETKFCDEMMVTRDSNDKFIKINSFPYKLLNIYIGKQLDVIHKKLLNDFSGFIGEKVETIPLKKIKKIKLKEKNIDLLLNNIKKYNINCLVKLELILVGEVVTITLEEPIFDEERNYTYTEDEIELSLSQLDIYKNHEFKNPEFEDYYSYWYADVFKEIKLQKLNYEDFINLKNDFVGIVKEKLEKIENEILKQIQEFINQNIDKIENIKHLINSTIIKEFKKANLFLINCFDYSDNENSYVILRTNNHSKIPMITDAMNIVYERKEKFIDKIKKDFSFYYVEEFHETEFSKSLKKLDFDSNKKSVSKKNNWEYVFELILNGDIIVIQKNQFIREYYFKEISFKSPTKLGNHITTVIDRNTDLRSIVTDSINGGKTKDIFINDKLIKIKEYLSINDNKMCAFFQEKYDDLLKK